MRLRLNPTKNRQRAKVRFAEEFPELRDGTGRYDTLSARLGAGT